MEKENIFKHLKNKLEQFMVGTNNIASLMRDKVNPYILMEETPVPIQIGKYTIFIGNFTIQNNYKFWVGYGRILALIGLKFENFDLIASGGELWKALMIHKKLYKDLCKLIYETICKQQAYYLDQMPNEIKRTYKKWKNMSCGYFIKNISLEKLIQLCRLIYIYNFDAEKKNLSILMFQLPVEGKETMRTYMSSYLENMIGLTGKFQVAHITKPERLSTEESLLKMGITPKKMGDKNEKRATKKI